uniref:Uncharacterized protein n=1 Tax=Anguilla anguilla TaxID=7936 RepID=A0A0E9P7V8_ANGAN
MCVYLCLMPITPFTVSLKLISADFYRLIILYMYWNRPSLRP